eukprot:TRINITY_DN5705_c0_g1_i2.p2 TRINITY_DN5705_c0_g1~~TRINITY_DN5705_c0_g1_i2.p2  ORF type:complete len:131 (+),score=35.22 TRINITY_DN5705_c0_g1_i2:284-676(+)
MSETAGKDEARDALNVVICNWARDYQYAILPAQDDDPARPDGRRHFRTVWSKRSAREPIPEAVVSVYFTMVPKQPRGYRITYVIEKQRYVHSVDDALQFQPAWLERVLEAKVAAVDKLYELNRQPRARKT